MTLKNLALALCAALASWGCAPTRHVSGPTGGAGTVGGNEDTGGSAGGPGTGGSGGRADRPDSAPIPSTGGAGGMDAAGPGGVGGSDAAPPDAVALQPDASGGDSPERSCAGGAIAFNAN